MKVEEGNMPIYKRVFVVGCARSGTTLLQGMLAAHSRVYSLPETVFFGKVLPRSWIKRNFLWPAIKVRSHLKRLVHYMGRDDLLPLAYVGMFQRDYHAPFVTVMDRMTSDAGRDIWVEKTPWHIYCIEEIQRRIPDALFIHIVRDGRDTVASLYDATHRNPSQWAAFPSIRTFKGFSIKQCVNFWNREVAITMRYMRDPRHCVVRYENIVSSPKKEMDKLCRFLGIDFEQSMMAPEASFNTIVRSDEIWKVRNASEIRCGERLFDTVFNDAERAWIESHLHFYPLPDQ